MNLNTPSALPISLKIARWCRIVAFAAAMIAISGCNNSKKVFESDDHMKVLSYALSLYQSPHKAWPDKLDQVAPYLAASEGFNHAGEGKDLAALMSNPLTGDNPGYEYVKPKADLTGSAWDTTVVLYQLRDGKRDTSLPVAFLDGSVRAQ